VDHPRNADDGSAARWRRGVLLCLLAAASIALGAGATKILDRGEDPRRREITVVRPTPNLILAIRDLARLETAAYHMERVIDLSDRQSRLFGLIEAEDAMLLVAVGEVIAGVDLEELRSGDVLVSPDGKTVRILLPPARVFSSRLDADRTYVHTRRTDVLAKRKEDLETRARKEAERSITEGALEGGILGRAEAQAEKTVRRLVLSLGITSAEIAFRRGAESPEGRPGVYSTP
jgi:hypothetical protein